MSGPLDRIRAAELEAARRLETARDAADARIAEARRLADELVRSMRKEGRSMADARFEQAIADATQQAKNVEAEPETQIAALRREVEPRLDELSAAMLDLILAPPAEPGV